MFFSYITNWHYDKIINVGEMYVHKMQELAFSSVCHTGTSDILMAIILLLIRSEKNISTGSF
jgi:hypothetical protein